MVASCSRIAFAGRRAVLVEGLMPRINDRDDMVVVSAETDSETALEAAMRHQPNVVVIDVDIPGEGAFSLAASLADLLPLAKLIFCGDYFSDVLLDRVLQLSSSGYLLTTDSSDQFISALRSVCRGEFAFSAEVKRRVEYDADACCFVAKFHKSLKSLTHLQLTILRRLVEGQSVKLIADEMSLTEGAVDGHKYRIMQRFEVHDRVELARYAIREGLVIP